MKQLMLFILTICFLLLIGVSPATAVEYSIEFQFGIPLPAENLKVAIVNLTPPVASHPIVWKAFSPKPIRTISWTNQYSLYGSDTIPIPGHCIDLTRQVENVLPGRTYIYMSDKEFAGGREDLAVNQYGIENKVGSLVSFSLVQRVDESDNCKLLPLNAIPLLPNQIATFTPIEKVAVFLADVNSGDVISQLPTNTLILDFTESTEKNIRYDSTTGIFTTEFYHGVMPEKSRGLHLESRFLPW